jgi:hypothetical protein
MQPIGLTDASQRLVKKISVNSLVFRSNLSDISGLMTTILSLAGSSLSLFGLTSIRAGTRFIVANSLWVSADRKKSMKSLAAFGWGAFDS